jgi:hypothetical protein
MLDLLENGPSSDRRMPLGRPEIAATQRAICASSRADLRWRRADLTSCCTASCIVLVPARKCLNPIHRDDRLPSTDDRPDTCSHWSRTHDPAGPAGAQLRRAAWNANPNWSHWRTRTPILAGPLLRLWPATFSAQLEGLSMLCRQAGARRPASEWRSLRPHLKRSPVPN